MPRDFLVRCVLAGAGLGQSGSSQSKETELEGEARRADRAIPRCMHLFCTSFQLACCLVRPVASHTELGTWGLLVCAPSLAQSIQSGHLGEIHPSAKL